MPRQPNQIDSSPSAVFSVPAKVIGALVRRTIFAASPNPSPAGLNCVFWTARNGVLELVATDGHRLALAANSSLPMDLAFEVLVPVQGLTMFLHMVDALEKMDQDMNIIDISLADEQMAFQMAAAELRIPLASEVFPEYQNVIPSNPQTLFTARTRDFRDLMRRATKCCANSDIPLEFNLDGTRLRVSNPGPPQAFAEDLAVESGGLPLSAGFNPQFILDILERIDSERAVVSMIDPTRPALIEPEGETPEYRFVVMPMVLPA